MLYDVAYSTMISAYFSFEGEGVNEGINLSPGAFLIRARKRAKDVGSESRNS